MYSVSAKSRKIPGFHFQKSRDFHQSQIPGSRDSRDPAKAWWPVVQSTYLFNTLCHFCQNRLPCKRCCLMKCIVLQTISTIAIKACMYKWRSFTNKVFYFPPKIHQHDLYSNSKMKHPSNFQRFIY